MGFCYRSPMEKPSPSYDQKEHPGAILSISLSVMPLGERERDTMMTSWTISTVDYQVPGPSSKV